MARVLVIANLFHASPRIPGVTTHLKEFGWDSTIVTPPLTEKDIDVLGVPKKFNLNVDIVEAPYRGDVFWFWRSMLGSFGLRNKESMTEQLKDKLGISAEISLIDKAMQAYQTVFAYPDPERTWLKPALRVSRSLLRKKRHDAILSSMPFATSHVIACKLKEEFGIPWLADFRDPWTQNQNYNFGAVRKYFEEKLERRIVGQVDAMTAAAPAYADAQLQFHQKPVTVITNGFDPDKLNDPPAPLTEKMTITYTGPIYTGKHRPEILLEALSNLIKRGQIDPKIVEVRFYGPKRTWLDSKIDEYSLSHVVNQCGAVPRDESIRKQRESQILLLLNWEDTKGKGWYPLKLFEYMAARRPVLAIGGVPGADVQRLIDGTKVGICALMVKDVELALLYYYDEYKTKGNIAYVGNEEQIHKYSYREMAFKFANTLNEIIG